MLNDDKDQNQDASAENKAEDTAAGTPVEQLESTLGKMPEEVKDEAEAAAAEAGTTTETEAAAPKQPATPITEETATVAAAAKEVAAPAADTAPEAAGDSDDSSDDDDEDDAPAKGVIMKKSVAEEDEQDDSSDEDEEDGDLEIEEDDTSGVTGSAFDDFDWSQGNATAKRYSDADYESMLKEYDAAITNISESEIVAARVSSISDSGDVLLDLNYKSDGLLSLSEFRDTPDLAVGDTVDVYVEQQEDERGQLVLSRRKAKLLRAWDRIRESYHDGVVINGKVISKTKGGLIVDCGGLETFLPGSQIDIKPIIDYDSYVGKTMEFKVVKINETIKNAVVSHKALIESDLAEQREAIIASLERGQVLEGLVKNITDFGAFLDLGGVDGLLYITDISWGRINHPSEVLELNQKINVVVLDFDENKKRISLGLKQLQPHPWEVLDDNVTEGSTVEGRVVNIEDYGAFLEIMPGVE
ncbi:MAG: S1 RNA-binding domain-containing protein, partial [Saprospiraceae bacterium]